jgi:outer membrane receptor protein involved in Fe transport
VAFKKLYQTGARLVRVAAVSGSLLVFTSAARADERTEARREFRAGMQAIAEGRYDDGVARLERAYQILPHPNVLFNLGLAYMYAGRDEDALLYFERFKESAPPGESGEVDALIRKLRPQEPEPAPQPPPALTAPPVAAPGSEATPEDVPVAAAPARSAQPAKKKLNPKPAGGERREGVYEERVTSASRISQSPLDAPNATAIITAQDIRMSGVTQLSALLRRVAGVEVATVAPYHAEISIRGLNRRSSNKVLLLLDGRPMRKDFLGTSWIDMMPIQVDDIERIEVIRGPASALYGADAFAGVINVITRAPGQGGSFAVGRFGNKGQYQGGASFSGKASPNVAYRASAMYSQANAFKSLVGPNRVDVVIPNGEPNRSYEAVVTNADVAWSYAKNSVAAIGGNYIGGDFTIQGLSRLGQVVSDPSYDAQIYGLLTTPVGIRVSTTYDRTVGHPRPGFIAPGSISAGPSHIRQELYDLDVSWSGAFKLLFPQTFTVGVAYRYKYIDWDWLDDQHTQNHIGAYLQDVIQLAKPLRLQVGARIDRHPLLSSLQFSPRASLVYRFFGEQSLRLSGGRAFRGPSFMESYLQLPNDTPLRGITAVGKGNDNLDPESITSLELGYQNQQSDYFSLEANIYYNWIRDAILFTNNDRFTLSDFAGGNPLAGYDRAAQAFPVSALAFANERATYRQLGGEVGVRAYPMDGVDLYVNYAIHDTAPIEKSKVDPARANEQQTSLHKVNGGLQYRARSGLELAADVSWVSAQRWIEQVTDVDTGVRWQSYDLPSFMMLNARIGYRLFADKLELGVVGTNLTFQDKRQHPLVPPLDTRVLGTAKVRF